ncbi:dnaJ-like [Pontoporia blainvillei]|uniref:DnaJ-like n=1 Tax=Pontoporia blainvillei TaxID=48723 RepID=A0ABX0S3F4_PONBL|nr:dnaJ-like [Pontoporia blainvillei]
MKSWKRNVMRRNLLSFPVVFHVCPVEGNLRSGDKGTAFQPRRALGRVDAEIPDPLVDIGWVGTGVGQMSAEDWECGLILLRDSRPWQQLVRIVQRGWLELPWVTQRTHRQGNAPVASGRYCQPEEEVARLLTTAGLPEDELKPFHVLEVEATASDAELKKAYRQPAVMVHPDKNHHPRAEEALKVLRAAWDIVSNPERRKEYEMKRMAENELSRSVNEFLSKLQDDLKEAMKTMMHSRCQGKT